MVRLTVKEQAQAKGVGKHQLHIRSNVAYTSIDAYWENRVTNVSLPVLERIATALNVSVKDLIDNEPPTIL